MNFSGGGNGYGAAGTAVVNAQGVVTGVTITNPGSDYTSAPTITFSGGGGSGATATATISGVTLDNPIDVTTNSNAELQVEGGLILNGITWNISNAANRALLYFDGTQTLSSVGNSTLTFGSAGGYIYQQNGSTGTPAVLTIGSGILIDGQNGTVGEGGTSYAVINDGTIEANVPTSGNNDGVTVQLGDTGLNSGRIEALNGGVVNLGGLPGYGQDTFTSAQLNPSQITSDSSSTINLAGILNNTGSTLELTQRDGFLERELRYDRGGKRSSPILESRSGSCRVLTS